MSSCDCSSRFEVRIAIITDYAQFKRILSKGRHPSFIGKNIFLQNANNGGALFYLIRAEAAAVSLVNPRFGIMLALNVIPEHRNHGLGSAIVNYLMPNFVRSIESKVKFFERLGYRQIGSLKRGISLNTQIMARSALFDLAGKLNRIWK